MNTQKTFSESTGLVFRKIFNILWFFLPVILLVLIFLIELALPESEEPKFPPIEIEQENCYIEEYYEYLDKTTCSLEITFNQNVYEGSVTVAFYDKNDKELETLVIPMTAGSYLYDYDTKMVNSYFDVSGEVDSYEIIDYSDLKSAELDIYYEELDTTLEFNVYLLIAWAIFRCIYVIPLVISALFFNCKTYYINGHTVIVYAGRLHHYIKIDGRKIDEKNALISFSAITLTANLDMNNKIEVYIPSFTKRLTLRFNGILMST